jgi:hypothetical protein
MIPTHLRFGAVTLAASAVLFGDLSLVRPTSGSAEPAATLGHAGPAVASAAWVLAHAIAMAAFVLLLVSLPVVIPSSREPMPADARGALLTLIMPTLGVETYVLPAIGRLYQTGVLSSP